MFKQSFVVDPVDFDLEESSIVWQIGGLGLESTDEDLLKKTDLIFFRLHEVTIYNGNQLFNKAGPNQNYDILCCGYVSQGDPMKTLISKTDDKLDFLEFLDTAVLNPEDFLFERLKFKFSTSERRPSLLILPHCQFVSRYGKCLECEPGYVLDWKLNTCNLCNKVFSQYSRFCVMIEDEIILEKEVINETLPQISFFGQPLKDVSDNYIFNKDSQLVFNKELIKRNINISVIIEFSSDLLNAFPSGLPDVPLEMKFSTVDKNSELVELQDSGVSSFDESSNILSVSYIIQNYSSSSRYTFVLIRPDYYSLIKPIGESHPLNGITYVERVTIRYHFFDQNRIVLQGQENVVVRHLQAQCKTGDALRVLGPFWSECLLISELQRFYVNENDFLCKMSFACPENCLTCERTLGCLSCELGFFLLGSFCLPCNAACSHCEFWPDNCIPLTQFYSSKNLNTQGNFIKIMDICQYCVISI